MKANPAHEDVIIPASVVKVDGGAGGSASTRDKRDTCVNGLISDWKVQNNYF